MVVFGLGNPGAEYRGTRHNAGFETVEIIAALKGMKLRKRCFRNYRSAYSGDLVLVQPLTYMNRSGEAVPPFMKEGETYAVILDQMDLPPGKARIRMRGSSAGHNGLRSMISVLGEEIIRIYIGVGRPEGDVVSHVLSGFSPEDRALVDQAEKRAAEAVLMLCEGERYEKVAQYLNS